MKSFAHYVFYTKLEYGLGKGASLALGASREEGDEPTGQADAEQVVHVGGGAVQQVEGGDDHQGQEQGVVVEDGECCGLVLGNLKF